MDAVDWVIQASWSNVSLLKWIAIIIVIAIAGVLQAGYIYLIYNAATKPLILMFIPLSWCIKNIAATIYLGIGSPIGWTSIGTLISWIISAIFLPTMLAMGIISGIVDSSAIKGSTICNKANELAIESGVSVSDIVPHMDNVIDAIYIVSFSELANDAFLEYRLKQSIFDLSLTTYSSTAYWLVLTGYSATCIF